MDVWSERTITCSWQHGSRCRGHAACYPQQARFRFGSFLSSFDLEMISGLQIHCANATDFPVSLRWLPVMFTTSKGQTQHQHNSMYQTGDFIQLSTAECPLSVPKPHNAFSSVSPQSLSTCNNPFFHHFDIFEEWHHYHVTFSLIVLTLDFFDDQIELML